MDDIRRFYGETPSGYADATNREKMPPAFLAVRDTFLDCVVEDAPGITILDAGCGPGQDTDYFVTQGFDAYGIDITPEMVAYARDNADGTFHVMDINDLKFPDETFDGVWCNAAIFHVPPEEMHDGVDELYRVLTTDGVMHISYKLGADTKGRTLRKEKGDETSLQYRVTDREVRDMLDAAGFDINEDLTQVNDDGERSFGNYFCQK